MKCEIIEPKLNCAPRPSLRRHGHYMNFFREKPCLRHQQHKLHPMQVFLVVEGVILFAAVKVICWLQGILLENGTGRCIMLGNTRGRVRFLCKKRGRSNKFENALQGCVTVLTNPLHHVLSSLFVL